MPNKLDESLRPHLSALVDGELEPLEAIAIQRHVRHNDSLGAEQRSLEQLKLGVHLAGTRDDPPLGLRARLLAAVRSEAEAQRARRPLRWLWAIPATAAVVAAVTFAVALSGPWFEDLDGAVPIALAPAALDPPAATERPAPPIYELDDEALIRLVHVHIGDLDPVALRDMSSSGALVQHGELADGFLDNDGGRAGVVQASFMDCNPRQRGDTLAVFDADRINLPPAVDSALEGAGVYTDVADGVEIRITSMGDRLFVVLRPSPAASVSPI